MARARFPALVAAVLLAGACSERLDPRPAVILVSIDTLRADHLGLYGYERPTSPFLDRLGAQGIVFERAFTSAAWTLIAHMTMLTGLYPAQHGVVEGQHALAPAVPLLAERMRAAGYRTLGLYRPGWVAERHGFGRGFDVFRQHQSVEEAELHLFEELAHVAPADPLFLFLHLFDVHNDPADKQPPAVFSAPPPYQDLFLADGRDRLAGQTYKSLKDRPVSAREKEGLAALYDDGIRHVDEALARVFARLEAEGRLAHALVIVTSDHGESLCQRDNHGHGGPWQEGLRVPLILRLPGNARAGERRQEVAHLVDVVATVLDFAGLAADPDLPGHSLLAPLPSDRVVTGGNDPVEYMVQWPRKLVRFGQKFGVFDLQADPGELEKPRPATPAEFAALRAALRLAPGSEHAPVPAAELTPEERSVLDALGYGGEVDKAEESRDGTSGKR